ncbi:MAG: TonB-dependent receptor [Caulobacteraceae bacterium]|nr:MAG: TonB-dependent receptor [Caulobacteraceae bacterium]
MSGKNRSTFAFFTGVSLAALGVAAPAVAQEQEQGRVTDEIVVTAEKREASIQDVPIAISAFDESRLERLQLNDAQDLQLAIPNFQFSKQNFTGSNVAIRGVGTKVVATSGDAAVGIHINGAPVGNSPIFEGEFFDVQRVEVLRGPQGTLYGRNSSSGVLNVITQKAVPEEFSGRLEGTYGNYNTYKTNGYLNIPMGDTFAARVAGFYTKRDGFSEDVVSGNDVDGRDMYAVRGSLFAQLADNVDASLMVQYFKEDSNRSRIGKQLCTRDNRPWPFSQGCLNTGLGFDALNPSASLGGLGALIFPGFDPDGAGPIQPTLLTDAAGIANPGNNPDDLRQVALTFQPHHEVEDFFANFEFNWDFGPVTFTSLTSIASNQISSQVDYNQSFGGQALRPTVFNPTGPFTGPRTGTQSYLATFDDSSSNSETWTQEFRLTSDLDGWLNYTVGYILIDGEVTDSRYQVVSNSLEAINIGLGIPLSFEQSFYENFTGLYHLEASALFGEVYLTPTDDLKLTIGLRRTSDDKLVQDRQTLLQGVPRSSVPLSTRTASFDETTGRITLNYSSQLPFTDETNWYASYSKGYKGGGINPPFDPNLFVGVARTFDPEFVNAYEVGMKNVLGDGRMTANLAGFYYEYQGYQITRIVNRTSVNANLDATIKGLEAEFTWEPTNGLVFDLNLGYLNSEITDSIGGLVDPINVTNGNAGYTGVSDALRWTRTMAFNSSGVFLGTVGASGATFTSSTVPAGSTVRQVTVADIAGANGAGAQGAAVGIISTPSLATISTAARCIVPNAAITAIAGINPALMPFACQLGRGFGGDPLAGGDGIKRLLEGNDLPNTPEWTVSFGAQYTMQMGGNWAATARADYFYQADSFSRIFNAANDQLDSYSQINASLRFENEDAGVYANFFVKNIADDDVVTDLYLTDQSSGLFSNAFLLEPRTYGITLGKRF